MWAALWNQWTLDSFLLLLSLKKEFPFHLERKKTREIKLGHFFWMAPFIIKWMAKHAAFSLGYSKSLSPNISSAMPNFFFSLSLQFSLLFRVCINCNSFVSLKHLYFIFTMIWWDVVVMTSKKLDLFCFDFFYVEKIRKTFQSPPWRMKLLCDTMMMIVPSPLVFQDEYIE